MSVRPYKRFVLLILLLPAFYSHAQIPTYTMRDTVVTDCKGILKDSEKGLGGSTYGHNEDFTFTIYTGGPITISFESLFCVEQGVDFLTFHNGPLITSPQIGPSYSGTTPPPPITATSGYLTIHFTSDANVAYCGWKAKWTSKVPPPVPPPITVTNPPLCNATKIIVDLQKPVHCDSVYAKAFTVNGMVNPIVLSAIPLNCSKDSTKSVELQIDKPININCNYTVKFNLSLPDRCDSIYYFTVITSFMVNTCPLNIQITPSSDKVCVGSCVTLKASVDGCLGYSYSWSHGLPKTVGPHTVCPPVTTTYTLNVSDGKGASAATTVTISISNPTITAPQPKICQSDPAFNFIGTPAGGTWTGKGIMDTKTGWFIPDSAGPGTHTIYYDLSSSCKGSVQITVDPMNAGYDEAACIGAAPFYVSGYSPAGGTWTGAGIQPNGLFTPSAIGTYTITYTHPNGCAESKNVNVNNLIGPIKTDTVCQSVPAYPIQVTPFGGRWTGKGVDSIYGIFDPDIAKGGLHTLTYKLHGCSIQVKIYVKPIDAGYSTTACPLQGQFLITPAATPSGGSWSGKGIIDPLMGQYDPWKANGGKNINDRLIYTLPNGCRDTIYMNVVTTAISKDTLFFCLNTSSLILNNGSTGRTPSGGVWTGQGISKFNSDYYFQPSAAGVGLHKLIYEKNICKDSVNMVVFPNKLSKSTASVCTKTKAFVLDSMPPGGKWKGTGVVNTKTGLFDPSLAGAGIHKIAFSTPAGCRDTFVVTVYPFIAAKIGGVTSSAYCYKDTAIKITLTPPGGTFTGFTGSVFNPATVGPGKHTLIYSYGQGECFTSDTASLTVYPKLTTLVTTSKDTICGDGGSTITVSPSGGNPNAQYQYQWTPSLFPVNSHTVGPKTSTLYIVKTSDGCSTPAVDSVLIHVYPAYQPQFVTSPKLCYGEKGFIKINILQPGNYVYQWGTSPAQTGDSIQAPAGGIYTVKIAEAISGCTFDTLVKVPSYKVVTALFSPNPSFDCIPFDQKEVTFIDLSKNATGGTWDFGKGDSIPYVVGNNPKKSFDKAGIYTVKLSITNEGGCLDEYEMEICILEPTPLFVPDIFSPNGDGMNDVLYVRAKGVQKLLFIVYDRWGEKVFETTHPDIGWDGTLRGQKVNTGVFTYYLEVIFNTKEKVFQKGDITLVR